MKHGDYKLVFEAIKVRTGEVIKTGSHIKCRNAAVRAGNHWVYVVRRMQPMTPMDLGFEDWKTLANNGFWQPSSYDKYIGRKLYWY